MYQLKSVARRLTLLVPAFGLLGAVAYQAILPAVSNADALNPLTKRSLLLTSSSPGWAFLDGSGNSTYAPPGSGPNGQKTGETFTFNTSSDTSSGSTKVKAFTLQYCTTAAGDCLGPGDDLSDPGGSDDSTHSDLNVVGSWSEGGTVTSNVPTTTAGDFQVYLKSGGSWAASSGWTMTKSNIEDQTDIVSGSPITGQTGKNNFITLTNSTGITPASDEEIELQFQPNGSDYITNPGQDAFFVKINDYSLSTYQNFRDNYPNDDSGANDFPQDTIDGGVTVAQVMNQSIEIQTKVLETMDFSVGTVDPDTEPAADLTGSAHGQCDAILPNPPNGATQNPANPSPDTLLMGNQDAEYSLSPTTPYDTTSLFRIGTNAANGATVYYSGATLHDTEGNAIAPMSDNATSDAAAFADAGTEQFGLGLNFNSVVDNSDYYANGGHNLLTPETLDSGFTTDVSNNSGSPYWYDPTLSPLLPTPSYGDANGSLASGSGPKFAYNSNANTTPVPIATENVEVVNCSTGMVRYVADIAPSTPAGIYTTAINYLAAPEY